MRKPDRIDAILFILIICVFFIKDLFSTLETQKMKTKELIELLKSMPDQGACVEVLIDGKYYRFVGAFDIPATTCENGRLVLMGASDPGGLSAPAGTARNNTFNSTVTF